MTPTFATSFDALGAWRAELAQRLDALGAFVRKHALADEHEVGSIAALHERIGHEKLVVAFVAEFSRGKSELINAIFFADTGRRVLPATPGRTTMCPVELGWQFGAPATLKMLPIESRSGGFSLAELRARPEAWTTLALELDDPEQLAATLTQVTRTQWVAQDEAVALGFWHDDALDDNPPVSADGRVEVPMWRHALINYPHPLLRQGLVVLDTPGLNAIGAEPELTLGLLPSAHATIFILGADTGVTKSDHAVWRDHLGGGGQTRFVVLNKIDALADPLASAAAVDAQIGLQCRATAATLGVGVERVFPLSAREALSGRIGGDAALLAHSRLPALEAALATELLPQRRQVLERTVLDGADRTQAHVARRIGEQRRQLAEQLVELRGVRGKSGKRLSVMLNRVDAETAEFEQCMVRLQALRNVHRRMLREALSELSPDRLRDEVHAMQAEVAATRLKLGARKSFAALCTRLRDALAESLRRNTEIRDMLAASFTALNADFGFGLTTTRAPDLVRYRDELMLIEHNYVKYLGPAQVLRLSQPRFMEQFRRMLASKLRVVFDNAAAELELWNKSTSAQIDGQLRERRRGFVKRRESLERVQAAAGDLEARVEELEGQERRLLELGLRVVALAEALRAQAVAGPQTHPGMAEGADSTPDAMGEPALRLLPA
jgi:Dynamin family